MTEQFDMKERLYRAIYSPEIMPFFWKKNGEISSAVFKDKNGLSVERSGDRKESEVIENMRLFFVGSIISVTVEDCIACNAVVKYLPTKRSIYHSEIHGSEEERLLSQSQCKYMTKKARLFMSVC